ncbi:sugar transferase [Aeromonas schubertii]|uniref:Sugar transferase n=1 Tax=Aeromonas schubertii TaxID=652 RepID=A0A0S2SFH8_9GAMM|nr:sugar transferase [Aeromonas schubertii]ALP40453.1 sugar transferase involved in lipopolysaccharide synthesis [Aeromonas schubertii]KUE79057.1 sugar transferase [Aeromonas schubertii]MBZ6065820.1 sugar transferase [Aeromonas schubertii]MBZ6072014.1 sugar transferase [Aeromonas schubertii]QCG48179.1 sugar transferase [Aeromonas schubertii]
MKTSLSLLTRRIKRGMDVAGAATALAISAPLWPLIALAVRLDSPGPVIFRQMRIGAALPDRSTLFYMLKFRTMRSDAEQQSGPVWCQKEDPRITRVGRFLRRSRLDELPQLINVLRGEMSLIGPRPERPGIANRLEGAIPFFIERTFDVLPGITGLAQVNQGYDEDLASVRSKLAFDLAYIVQLHHPWRWLVQDLTIVWLTLMVMVGLKGR